MIAIASVANAQKALDPTKRGPNPVYLRSKQLPLMIGRMKAHYSGDGITAESLELFLDLYIKESLRRVPYIGIIVHLEIVHRKRRIGVEDVIDAEG